MKGSKIEEIVIKELEKITEENEKEAYKIEKAQNRKILMTFAFSLKLFIIFFVEPINDYKSILFT